MTRSRKVGKISRQLRREAKAALRLSPVILAALLLVVAFWRSDSAANSGLFQSSPVETPANTAAPTIAITATALPTTPAAPTTMPPGEGTPTEEATLPVPPDTPTTLPLETATAESSPTPAPDAGTLTPEPAPETATATPAPTATPDPRARYSEGDSNLKFEWGMLFDSVSLLLSYAWLCCGVLIFVAVPVLFIALWVAGKRRQQPGEPEDEE